MQEIRKEDFIDWSVYDKVEIINHTTKMDKRENFGSDYSDR